MRLGYKKLGSYIQIVNERNKALEVDTLLGVSIRKCFMPSIANTVGTDMSTYKIVRKKQFAYGPVTSRNGDKISVAFMDEFDIALVSQAYTVFEVVDHEDLDPEYLMMWFRRPEFDRYARFKSHGSAREIFDWDEMCDTELPIPSIQKQREIVKEYNTIVNRIALNEQLNQKLEETAQAIYKQWFVDFEFPNEDGKPYFSSGGKMVWCEELDKEVPEGWKVRKLASICEKIGSGSTPKGGKDAYYNKGTSLIRSLNVHDFTFLYENLAFINDEQARKLNGVSVLRNDILLNITGASVARCTIVPEDVLPARVNQHVSIIRPSKEYSFCFYLLCFLCSTDCKKELVGLSESGSTRQAVTKSEIEDLNILIPKGESILTFEKNVGQLFRRREKISSENQQLKEIKELVLAKMTKVEIEKEIM
ncbi:MAG: restriction endonuclease subunit S [Bacteroidota bacterium]